MDTSARESGSADTELESLEQRLLASIPRIRRARREWVLVRERAKRSQENVRDSPGTQMTVWKACHRFAIDDRVAFSESRFPGFVWASEWEVVELLTRENGQPAYRIRSPDGLRLNTVADRDLPMRAGDLSIAKKDDHGFGHHAAGSGTASTISLMDQNGDAAASSAWADSASLTLSGNAMSQRGGNRAIATAPSAADPGFEALL